MDPSQDPIVRKLREQVSDVDRGLVEAINARLRLVAQLKSYKDSRGYRLRRSRARGVDVPGCQRARTAARSRRRAWRGIYQAILDLSKREVS